MTIYDEAFLHAVRGEVTFARNKFPSNKHLMTALTEELGEAAMALLDHHHKGAPVADVWMELKQVACVAMRLATEGDPDFAYRPSDIEFFIADRLAEPANPPGSLSINATVGGDFTLKDVSFGPTTVLPDGSGMAVASMALPDDHWLMSEERDAPPMPFRIGVSEGRHADHMGPRRGELAEMIRAAGRYAIRASTMNGQSMDFDPDAMLQNLVVGMLGYFSEDGLCGGGEDPTPVPPMLKSITWESPK
jgi:hypothetical protein